MPLRLHAEARFRRPFCRLSDSPTGEPANPHKPPESLVIVRREGIGRGLARSQHRRAFEFRRIKVVAEPVDTAVRRQYGMGDVQDARLAGNAVAAVNIDFQVQAGQGGCGHFIATGIAGFVVDGDVFAVVDGICDRQDGNHAQGGIDVQMLGINICV